MKQLFGFRLLLCFLVVSVFASTKSPAQSQREKKIDFEDSVVEGVNKRPLDSLAQIADGDGKRKRLHLYNKRQNFNQELKESLKELRLVQ